MAAQFAVGSADVEAPDGTVHAKVAVSVRGSRLTVRTRGVHPQTIVDDATVTESTVLSRRVRQVTTGAGVWTVTRKGCGCGSR